MANDDERGARGPAAELAVRHLRTLKPEHQELLGVLMADAGMGTETLEVLVEHLFEEEDPRLVSALHRARAGGGAAAILASVRAGATVGSLRVESAPPARSRPESAAERPRHNSVGPASRALPSGASVGSLRAR